MDRLKHYKIKAVFYVLGWLKFKEPDLYREIVTNGHIIGCHGYWHKHNETSDKPLFRSPYWDTTPMPWPPAGGFFLRAMPYPYLKWAVGKSGQMWIHPHDLDEGHPRLDNKLLDFKRHIGLKNSRNKLERLLKEIEWDLVSLPLKS